MKKYILIIAVAILSTSGIFAQSIITKTGHAKFYSHTAIEDIEANNYKVISKIKDDGTFVVSVPMQSFDFEKALMQKHFNSGKFLNTKKFPKASFKGKINKIIDFNEDGEYDVEIPGKMTIHGESKDILGKGKISIAGGKVKASSSFDLTLADYGIAFKKGKPSTNIAKTIKIDVEFAYD